MAVHLVYNPSDSVARGWYRIAPVGDAGALQVDDIVLARLPAAVAAFAAQRHYLPAGVPILKRVGAVAPQAVCVQAQQVRIDGAIVATVRMHDGARRTMQAWRSCRHLIGGELFLLSSTNPASFDSRYFGPVNAAAVLGVAHPVWTW
ncbi:S26 family signal peptidase [Acidovorax sp. NCPPB 4044]|nr:S26 family signal peptidase [Acidovorax sp. NCPPB 4044]